MVWTEAPSMGEALYASTIRPRTSNVSGVGVTGAVGVAVRVAVVVASGVAVPVATGSNAEGSPERAPLPVTAAPAGVSLAGALSDDPP
jgi:hypothetical protein